MERALEEGDDLIEDLLDDLKQLEDKRTSIAENEDELLSIANRLEDEDIIDNERAKGLEERRQSIQSRISSIDRDIGELDGKIEQQKKRLLKSVERSGERL